MRILLCNDTATQAHVGCQAVSYAHAVALGRMGHTVHKRYFVGELGHFRSKRVETAVKLLKSDPQMMLDIENSNAVVVNGEGSIHHDQGSEYLALLHLAKQLGKITLLVNSLYEEMSVGPQYFKSIDRLIVRDMQSLTYVQSLGIQGDYAPDSIIGADFNGPAHMDCSDKIIVTDWVKSRDADVGQTCMQYFLTGGRDHSEFVPLHGFGVRTHWRQMAATFATARAVVTGRHHGVYIAILAGVPFVPLASNSWKIEGMLQALGLNFPVVKSYSELLESLDDLQNRKAAVNQARELLLSKTPLRIFDVLGGSPDLHGEQRELALLAAQLETRPGLLHKDALSICKRRAREAAISEEIILQQVNSKFDWPARLKSKIVRTLQ